MTKTSHLSTVKKIGSFVRYAWDDTLAAQRALLRTQPYDDYLFNRRGHGSSPWH